ncbi:hypothetical protein DN614_33110, partial [Klebsiella michiganensis]
MSSPHIPIGLGAHSTDWRISLAQGTESLGCHFALSRNRPHNRGITWYNFVSDQYSGFHGIVIPGTLRDSIFVLEGLLEQETG